MKQNEIKNQVFEVMLKAAVEENFEKKLKELPQTENLPDDCELSESTKYKIQRMIRKASRDVSLSKLRKTAKKAAVVIAVIIPISLGSLLGVEASRNAIFNAFLDWKSNHVDIHYQDKEVSSNENQTSSASGSSAIKPQYLPEGFFESQAVKIGPKNETEYQNSKGVKIFLDQIPLSQEGTIAVDTEHAARKEIEIQGKKAALFVADSSGAKSYLAWEDHSYSFLLSSEISSDQLVKIAQSMG